MTTFWAYFIRMILVILGLSAPVPRGRKGRKSGKKLEQAPKKSPAVGDLAKIDIDPERILMDSNYKKHLKRHANKYEATLTFHQIF